MGVERGDFVVHVSWNAAANATNYAKLANQVRGARVTRTRGNTRHEQVKLIELLLDVSSGSASA